MLARVLCVLVAAAAAVQAWTPPSFCHGLVIYEKKGGKTEENKLENFWV